MNKILKIIMCICIFLNVSACNAHLNEEVVEGYMGDIRVKVDFKDNKISNIDILESEETLEVGMYAMNQIIGNIIEKQSTDVDIVSGATISSKALISAVDKIIKKSNIKLVSNEINDQDSLNGTKDYYYDVVVVGGGGAGLTAATTAAMYDKKVALLEKTEALGGNTLIATAMYNCVDPKLQTEFGIYDSEELFFEETYYGGHMKGKKELVRILTSQADEGLDFLKDLGLKIKPIIDNCLGGKHARGHFSKASNGTDYIQVLEEACKDNGVDIFLNTKAYELILQDRRVVGVKTTKNKETINYYANNVILATGGFGYNVEMRMKYDKSLTGDMLCSNTPSTLGEGIQMAEAINASLINMQYIELYPMADVHDGGLHNSIPNAMNKGILVNKEGKRFIREDAGRDELSKSIQAQTDGFVYSIVDDDYSNEIEERDFLKGLVMMGHVKKANSIEELALMLDMDHVTLKRTIDEYNRAIEINNDNKYGRLTLENKIDKAPYYANAKTVTIHHTLGGIEINENAQVIDNNRGIIEGLFACGEVTGGIHGANRLGGNSFPDMIVFGRIAGKNAALIQ